MRRIRLFSFLLLGLITYCLAFPSPAYYPTVLVCTTYGNYVYPKCQYRTGFNKDFQPCGKAAAYIQVVKKDVPTNDYCTAYNLEGKLYAEDPYSIITLDNTENTVIDHVALFVNASSY